MSFFFFQFYVNDSKVVEGNIPCSNGIIHLISTPFSSQELNEFPTQSSKVDIGVVVGVVVVAVVIAVVVVAGVLCYKRSQQGFWTLLHTWISTRKVNVCSVKLPQTFSCLKTKRNKEYTV